MNEEFTDKVVFVTGAASGIGRTTAVAFARAGADVAVADITEEGVQETASMVEEAGGQAVAVRCDVTQAEDIQAALDETTQAFGGLDFAFNNAGVEQERERRSPRSRKKSGIGVSTPTSVVCSCA